jgi:hypothetical protein
MVLFLPLATRLQSDATSSVFAFSATLPKAAAGIDVLRLKGTAIAETVDENVDVLPTLSVTETVTTYDVSADVPVQ